MKLLSSSSTLTLVLLLLLTSSYLQATMGDTTFCDGKCKQRCAKAGVMDRCLNYCGVCCAKCKCVPSGTYGNKDECPCYRDMLNSKKKSKCP